MSVIINIGLTYVVCKLRNAISERGVTEYSIPTIKTMEYVRQTANCSCDAVSLVQTNNFRCSFNRNESTLTVFDETDFKVKEIKNKETAVPKITEEGINQPVISNNRKAPVQHIISPDMMKELCSGVLQKIKRNESASLTELDKLQKECIQDNEKLITYSTQADDLVSDLEDYDVVPKPVPVKNSKEDDEEIYQGVYDSPVHDANWDAMKEYKLPKPSEGPFLNSLYMNAREPVL